LGHLTRDSAGPDHRPRRTKTEVKEKLRDKHQELAAGIRTPATYTVERCLNDWLQTLSRTQKAP
jgi:hypothetical protein